MNIKENKTGIVLAGGKSSRMGRNKALIGLGNKTLLEHAIDKLLPFCSEIIISSNDMLTSEYKIIKDEILNSGPLSGIISCLRSASYSNCIVLSCDMPFMSGEIIKQLIIEHDSGITVPTTDGIHLEPVCAIYSKNIVNTLEEYCWKGNYKLHDIIEETNCKKVSFKSFNKNEIQTFFFNINDAGDLSEAQIIYKKYKDLLI